MVYDCTKRETFQSIKNWIKQIDDHAETGIMKFLICNKIDMRDEQQVSQIEAESLCKEYGLNFFECSAKSGEGVEQVFKESSSKVISSSML